MEIGPGASVWFGCVLRGDVNRIVVGARLNLQDGTVVHLGDDDPTIIGEDVVVTAGAVIPPRSLVLGTPGKIVKQLDESAEDFHRRLAARYTRLHHNHRLG